MSQLKLKATSVFQKNYESQARITVNQGGSGSSKSYSLAQLFVIKALQTTGKKFSIVRKALPTLKATAMQDFFNVLQENGLYRVEDHNKTDHTYQLNGNTIEFFGLDDPQKARSRRRDYLWMNEFNEFSYEDYRQLTMRTNKQIFADFNPSDFNHWIYDHVLQDKDCNLLISTYKDNPFLPKEIIQEIEGYKDKDENYWRIYGLGERGFAKTLIYTHWQLKDFKEGEVFYGLDFGYNNPTALIKVSIDDNDLYAEEVIYDRYMTNQDLIEKMKGLCVSKDLIIFADSEDPNRIEEIKQAGFNCVPTIKGPDSVRKGIDEIKSRNLYVGGESVNLIKEFKSYSWKTKDDKILDEPFKVNDHGLDALRYGVYSFVLGAQPNIRIVGDTKEPSPFNTGGDRLRIR